ncbi:hypothetical protein KTJ87_08365 [Rhodobacteraceae bacterium ASV31]|nr:hypothetical protein [Anianabacter salinae]
MTALWVAAIGGALWMGWILAALIIALLPLGLYWVFRGSAPPGQADKDDTTTHKAPRDE